MAQLLVTDVPVVDGIMDIENYAPDMVYVESEKVKYEEQNVLSVLEAKITKWEEGKHTKVGEGNEFHQAELEYSAGNSITVGSVEVSDPNLSSIQTIECEESDQVKLMGAYAESDCMAIVEAKMQKEESSPKDVEVEVVGLQDISDLKLEVDVLGLEEQNITCSQVKKFQDKTKFVADDYHEQDLDHVELVIPHNDMEHDSFYVVEPSASLLDDEATNFEEDNKLAHPELESLLKNVSLETTETKKNILSKEEKEKGISQVNELSENKVESLVQEEANKYEIELLEPDIKSKSDLKAIQVVKCEESDDMELCEEDCNSDCLAMEEVGMIKAASIVNNNGVSVVILEGKDDNKNVLEDHRMIEDKTYILPQKYFEPETCSTEFEKLSDEAEEEEQKVILVLQDKSNMMQDEKNKKNFEQTDLNGGEVELQVKDKNSVTLEAEESGLKVMELVAVSDLELRSTEAIRCEESDRVKLTRDDLESDCLAVHADKVQRDVSLGKNFEESGANLEAANEDKTDMVDWGMKEGNTIRLQVETMVEKTNFMPEKFSEPENVYTGYEKLKDEGEEQEENDKSNSLKDEKDHSTFEPTNSIGGEVEIDENLVTLEAEGSALEVMDSVSVSDVELRSTKTFQCEESDGVKSTEDYSESDCMIVETNVHNEPSTPTYVAIEDVPLHDEMFYIGEPKADKFEDKNEINTEEDKMVFVKVESPLKNVCLETLEIEENIMSEDENMDEYSENKVGFLVKEDANKIELEQAESDTKSNVVKKAIQILQCEHLDDTEIGIGDLESDYLAMHANKVQRDASLRKNIEETGSSLGGVDEEKSDVADCGRKERNTMSLEVETMEWKTNFMPEKSSMPEKVFIGFEKLNDDEEEEQEENGKSNTLKDEKDHNTFEHTDSIKEEVELLVKDENLVTLQTEGSVLEVMDSVSVSDAEVRSMEPPQCEESDVVKSIGDYLESDCVIIEANVHNEPSTPTNVEVEAVDLQDETFYTGDPKVAKLEDENETNTEENDKMVVVEVESPVKNVSSESLQTRENITAEDEKEMEVGYLGESSGNDIVFLEKEDTNKFELEEADSNIKSNDDRKSIKILQWEYMEEAEFGTTDSKSDCFAVHADKVQSNASLGMNVEEIDASLEGVDDDKNDMAHWRMKEGNTISLQVGTMEDKTNFKLEKSNEPEKVYIGCEKLNDEAKQKEENNKSNTLKHEKDKNTFEQTDSIGGEMELRVKDESLVTLETEESALEVMVSIAVSDPLLRSIQTITGEESDATKSKRDYLQSGCMTIEANVQNELSITTNVEVEEVDVQEETFCIGELKAAKLEDENKTNTEEDDKMVLPEVESPMKHDDKMVLVVVESLEKNVSLETLATEENIMSEDEKKIEVGHIDESNKHEVGFLVKEDVNKIELEQADSDTKSNADKKTIQIVQGEHIDQAEFGTDDSKSDYLVIHVDKVQRNASLSKNVVESGASLGGANGEKNDMADCGRKERNTICFHVETMEEKTNFMPEKSNEPEKVYTGFEKLKDLGEAQEENDKSNTLKDEKEKYTSEHTDSIEGEVKLLVIDQNLETLEAERSALEVVDLVSVSTLQCEESDGVKSTRDYSEHDCMIVETNVHNEPSTQMDIAVEEIGIQDEMLYIGELKAAKLEDENKTNTEEDDEMVLVEVESPMKNDDKMVLVEVESLVKNVSLETLETEENIMSEDEKEIKVGHVDTSSEHKVGFLVKEDANKIELKQAESDTKSNIDKKAIQILQCEHMDEAEFGKDDLKSDCVAVHVDKVQRDASWRKDVKESDASLDGGDTMNLQVEMMEEKTNLMSKKSSVLEKVYIEFENLNDEGEEQEESDASLDGGDDEKNEMVDCRMKEENTMNLQVEIMEEKTNLMLEKSSVAEKVYTKYENLNDEGEEQDENDKSNTQKDAKDHNTFEHTDSIGGEVELLEKDENLMTLEAKASMLEVMDLVSVSDAELRSIKTLQCEESDGVKSMGDNSESDCLIIETNVHNELSTPRDLQDETFYIGEPNAAKFEDENKINTQENDKMVVVEVESPVKNVSLESLETRKNISSEDENEMEVGHLGESSGNDIGFLEKENTNKIELEADSDIKSNGDQKPIKILQWEPMEEVEFGTTDSKSVFLAMHVDKVQRDASLGMNIEESGVSLECVDNGKDDMANWGMKEGNNISLQVETMEEKTNFMPEKSSEPEKLYTRIEKLNGETEEQEENNKSNTLKGEKDKNTFEHINSIGGKVELLVKYESLVILEAEGSAFEVMDSVLVSDADIRSIETLQCEEIDGAKSTRDNVGSDCVMVEANVHDEPLTPTDVVVEEVDLQDETLYIGEPNAAKLKDEKETNIEENDKMVVMEVESPVKKLSSETLKTGENITLEDEKEMEVGYLDKSSGNEVEFLVKEDANKTKLAEADLDIKNNADEKAIQNLQFINIDEAEFVTDDLKSARLAVHADKVQRDASLTKNFEGNGASLEDTDDEKNDMTDCGMKEGNTMSLQIKTMEEKTNFMPEKSSEPENDYTRFGKMNDKVEEHEENDKTSILKDEKDHNTFDHTASIGGEIELLVKDENLVTLEAKGIALDVMDLACLSDAELRLSEPLQCEERDGVKLMGDYSKSDCMIVEANVHNEPSTPIDVEVEAANLQDETFYIGETKVAQLEDENETSTEENDKMVVVEVESPVKNINTETLETRKNVMSKDEEEMGVEHLDESSGNEVGFVVKNANIIELEEADSGIKSNAHQKAIQILQHEHTDEAMFGTDDSKSDCLAMHADKMQRDASLAMNIEKCGARLEGADDKKKDMVDCGMKEGNTISLQVETMEEKTNFISEKFSEPEKVYIRFEEQEENDKSNRLEDDKDRNTLEHTNSIREKVEWLVKDENLVTLEVEGSVLEVMDLVSMSDAELRSIETVQCEESDNVKLMRDYLENDYMQMEATVHNEASSPMDVEVEAVDLQDHKLYIGESIAIKLKYENETNIDENDKMVFIEELSVEDVSLKTTKIGENIMSEDEEEIEVGHVIEPSGNEARFLEKQDANEIEFKKAESNIKSNFDQKAIQILQCEHVDEKTNFMSENTDKLEKVYTGFKKLNDKEEEEDKKDKSSILKEKKDRFTFEHTEGSAHEVMEPVSISDADFRSIETLQCEENDGVKSTGDYSDSGCMIVETNLHHEPSTPKDVEVEVVDLQDETFYVGEPKAAKLEDQNENNTEEDDKMLLEEVESPVKNDDKTVLVEVESPVKNVSLKTLETKENIMSEDEKEMKVGHVGENSENKVRFLVKEDANKIEFKKADSDTKSHSNQKAIQILQCEHMDEADFGIDGSKSNYWVMHEHKVQRYASLGKNIQESGASLDGADDEENDMPDCGMKEGNTMSLQVETTEDKTNFISEKSNELEKVCIGFEKMNDKAEEQEDNDKSNRAEDEKDKNTFKKTNLIGGEVELLVNDECLGTLEAEESALEVMDSVLVSDAELRSIETLQCEESDGAKSMEDYLESDCVIVEANVHDEPSTPTYIEVMVVDLKDEMVYIGEPKAGKLEDKKETNTEENNKKVLMEMDSPVKNVCLETLVTRENIMSEDKEEMEVGHLDESSGNEVVFVVKEDGNKIELVETVSDIKSNVDQKTIQILQCRHTDEAKFGSDDSKSDVLAVYADKVQGDASLRKNLEEGGACLEGVDDDKKDMTDWGMKEANTINVQVEMMEEKTNFMPVNSSEKECVYAGFKKQNDEIEQQEKKDKSNTLKYMKEKNTSEHTDLICGEVEFLMIDENLVTLEAEGSALEVIESVSVSDAELRSTETLQCEDSDGVKSIEDYSVSGCLIVEANMHTEPSIATDVDVETVDLQDDTFYIGELRDAKLVGENKTNAEEDDMMVLAKVESPVKNVCFKTLETKKYISSEYEEEMEVEHVVQSCGNEVGFRVKEVNKIEFEEANSDIGINVDQKAILILQFEHMDEVEFGIKNLNSDCLAVHEDKVQRDASLGTNLEGSVVSLEGVDDDKNDKTDCGMKDGNTMNLQVETMEQNTNFMSEKSNEPEKVYIGFEKMNNETEEQEKNDKSNTLKDQKEKSTSEYIDSIGGEVNLLVKDENLLIFEAERSALEVMESISVSDAKLMSIETLECEQSDGVKLARDYSESDWMIIEAHMHNEPSTPMDVAAEAVDLEDDTFHIGEPRAAKSEDDNETIIKEDDKLVLADIESLEKNVTLETLKTEKNIMSKDEEKMEVEHVDSCEDEVVFLVKEGANKIEFEEAIQIVQHMEEKTNFVPEKSSVLEKVCTESGMLNDEVEEQVENNKNNILKNKKDSNTFEHTNSIGGETQLLVKDENLVTLEAERNELEGTESVTVCDPELRLIETIQCEESDGVKLTRNYLERDCMIVEANMHEESSTSIDVEVETADLQDDTFYIREPTAAKFKDENEINIENISIVMPNKLQKDAKLTLGKKVVSEISQKPINEDMTLSSEQPVGGDKKIVLDAITKGNIVSNDIEMVTHSCETCDNCADTMEEDINGSSHNSPTHVMDSSNTLIYIIKEATTGDEEGVDSSVLVTDLKPVASGSHGGNMSPKYFRSSESISSSRTCISSYNDTKVEYNFTDMTMTKKDKKLHQKLELIRQKFLYLLSRMGTNSMDFNLDHNQHKASQQDHENQQELSFSCNILVLGKIGVGKSTVINSIMGEEKNKIDAFDGATTNVRLVSSVVDGIKVNIIDTPGLRTNVMDQGLNKKILSTVNSYTKKCPPDIILYVDRLDSWSNHFDDIPLLKTITTILGTSIWVNTVVTFTHADSIPPDNSNGDPMSYETFIGQRSHVVQQSIQQATNDMYLINAFSFVENYPCCQRNCQGKKMLPTVQNWRKYLLILCYSTKPKYQPKVSINHKGLKEDSSIEVDDYSEICDDEYEYGQLPTLWPLMKAQFDKLMKDKENDECAYHVKLIQGMKF